MDQSKIRNFSIIAHIDHGKSTLADRILEVTDTVAERDMRAQLLDSMDLERERGITIKAQAVRVSWKGHELNLIDTPGHVDFTYEVSRSLQACEGALLVVDAAQGIEAQTLANAYLAIENGLEIVPVVNKIDLPSADPVGASQEVADLLGDDPEKVVRISAKTGLNVTDVLDAIIERVPAPAGDPDAPARALVFDSSYDQYRGVLAFVRVIDGSFSRREELQTMATGTRFDAEELGFFSPSMRAARHLSAGEVGYVITGLKDVSQLRVGDTLTQFRGGASGLPAGGEIRSTMASSTWSTLIPVFAEISTTSAGSPPSSFVTSSAAPSGSAEGRSILFTTGTISSSFSIARYAFASVCASIPCAASTTSTAPSHACSERDTSYVKSTCPGVSIRFN